MFEVIAIIVIVLAIAVAIVLILAATKPGSFSVQRSISVKAVPEKIFPWISDSINGNHGRPTRTRIPR